ncbi:hypothetical protein [Amycolatopsis sp.]|nr:hypothetical protein [Amycolatopsis sp.]HVV14561.1 hypothetical protein [Amycolatopsis sp.]
MRRYRRACDYLAAAMMYLEDGEVLDAAEVEQPPGKRVTGSWS